jgi:phosphinothricin acetyltransferase
MIRPSLPEDYPYIQDIHHQGLASGNASFLAQPLEWEEWDSGKLPACRLVAEEKGEIVGWAALAPFSSQCFYAGVAEVSLYVADEAQGRGVGSRLMQALIDCSEAQGLWSLQALIFPENEASLRLHRRFGFRDLGLMERPARMPDGRWRDVLILERRSKRAGIE